MNLLVVAATDENAGFVGGFLIVMAFIFAVFLYNLFHD